MTEPESPINSEVGHEESIVSEATVSEALHVEASTPVEASGILRTETTGSDSNAEPSATVAVKTTDQTPTVVARERVGDKVGVIDEQKKRSIAEKEEGKELTVEQEKGSTPKANTVGKKAKRLRQRKTAASATADTAKDKMEKTCVPDKVESALGKEDGNVEMETTVLTIATTSAAITAETANDNGEKELANKDKIVGAINKKNKKRKKRNKAQVAAAEAAGTAEVGAVTKSSVATEFAGMIFMCSAETKKDCYRYKVFGMPAGKKATVANIYKGMKLFLYDIDLKLLYGIYVATSKGGYNLQPTAFKSAFPSQVRFKALKDYLPLPEEKFKVAIKSNYYGKKKFRLELSAEQVKNLSKLFAEATKGSKWTNDRATRDKASKRTNDRAMRERVPQNFTSHGTKRRQLQGPVGHRTVDAGDRIFPRNHDAYEREVYGTQVPLQVPFFQPGPSVPRQAPLPLYPSPPRVVPLPPLPPGYVYERPIDADYYHRELPTEAHGYRFTDSGLQLPFDNVGRFTDSGLRLPFDNVGSNDPYSLHREPLAYHETRYAGTLPSSYHAPAPPSYPY